MLKALAIVLGLLAGNAVFASSSSQDYYDQIYEDDRLDVSIFFGYNQKEPLTQVTLPILKKILPSLEKIENSEKHRVPGLKPATTFLRPQRDEEYAREIVASVDSQLRACAECKLKQRAQGRGFNFYSSSFDYRGRTIELSVKFYFSISGVGLRFLREAFVRSLGQDDVIVYLGHARDGEGFPEFGSPTGNSGKVYYNDPVQGWLGFERGYFHPTKYQILVLNACQTERHYKKVLRSKIWEKDHSRLGLILSTADTVFMDYPSTTATLLTTLIAQQPREELLQALSDSALVFQSDYLDQAEKAKRKVPPVFKLFVGDGLFDSQYKEKRAPARLAPSEPWRSIPF